MSIFRCVLTPKMQLKTNDKNRRFGVSMTPLSASYWKLKNTYTFINSQNFLFVFITSTKA